MDARQMTGMQLSDLIDRYGRDLTGMCYLYLKDVTLSQDAMQEVWILVYRKWDQFHGKSNIKTWLTRITINVCKTMLRTRWHKDTVVGTELIEEIPDTDDYSERIESADMREGIMHTIEELPKKYKDVIILYYYNDLSIAEIADVLSIPSSTVGTRLDRARKKLKPYLKEAQYEI